MEKDDLISRAAAVRALASSNGDYLDALERFERLPAVDAVPVVRCRDCVYYNTTGCGAGFGWCEDAVVNTGVWDDFYCADGERRDDDAAGG